MTDLRRGFVLATLLAVALWACGGGESEPTAGASAPQAAPAAEPAAQETASIPPTEAAQLFASRCATCHGAEGAGDGAGAAALVPKPRNFRQAAWQESVSDEHIVRVISYGGAAVGLSPIMPAHPDLANQPPALAGLVAHVRSLRE